MSEKKKIMKFSFIIPAYNEEKNLKRFIPLLQKIVRANNLNAQVIIVNDNSNDATGKIAEDFSKIYSNIEIIHRDVTPGYGNALKEGFRAARGDIVVVIECDGNHRPQDIPKLVKKINEGYDIVIGSRFLGHLPKGYPFVRLIANRFYIFLLMILFGQKFYDPTNGFKAYRREVLNKIQINSKGFEINAEIFLKALKRNLNIAEIPVKWEKRKEGISKFYLPRVGLGYMKVALKNSLSKL